MTEKLTKDAVFRAADELEARGEKVTQNTLRAALGGGSFATLGPMLRDWRAAREESEELAQVPLPEQLENRGRELVAALWREATERAQAGHAALQAAVSGLEGRLREAEEEGLRAVATVEQELEEERAARAAAEERVRALELEAAGLRSTAGRVAAAEARADRAEARAEKLEAKADTAIADLATARADLATERAGAAALRDQLKKKG